MPINQDTHYVIKNGTVEQPAVVKDGLELYYDAKGKHNTDVHKDTLLDLSGNNRHGTLVNFAYEGVSGYQENGTGGILLDDVDDKIVRPTISGIEYTSASRNLLDYKKMFMASYSGSELYLKDGTSFPVSFPYTVTNTSRSIVCVFKCKENVDYSASISNCDENINISMAQFTSIEEAILAPINALAMTVSSGNDKIARMKTVYGGSVLLVGVSGAYSVLNGGTNITITGNELVQLEENADTTPYTPYVPLPIMTYQMNGNILSFEKDGTVKRTTKDANGNEVIISRKGINLIRNGNFVNSKAYWSWNMGHLKSFVVDGETHYIANSLDGITSTGIYQTPFYHKSNDKFLVCVDIFPKYKNSLMIQLEGSGGSLTETVIVNQWNTCKKIISGTGTGNNALTFYQNLGGTGYLLNEVAMIFKNIQLINLTESYGAGNEPDLTYIQAHPEEFAWTPNPNDLIETVEIKNNLVGDLENLQGNDFEQHEDGVVTYTNEAEEGSVVRVDIDGASFQDVGSGKNMFYKNEVYSKYSEINDDYLNISIGDRFFYPIDGVPKAQYTISFDYERDNTATPVSMSFYYTDGTSDENSQIMSSSDRVRLTLSSAIGKTVSGVGYNPPVVLGCSWKKIFNPTMERTGLAIDTAQEDESLGVIWNKLQNPIMERV